MSSEEALSVVANETRARILQTLGEAESQLSFAELRDRVDTKPGLEFNHRLEELVGHFVSKDEEGYSLGEPGARIVEAPLAGAVGGLQAGQAECLGA